MHLRICGYDVYAEPCRRTVAHRACDVATANLMFRSLVFAEISLFKMSSSESNSDLSCISDDDSEYNYIPGIYPDFETEWW